MNSSRATVSQKKFDTDLLAKLPWYEKWSMQLCSELRTEHRLLAGYGDMGRV